MLHIYEEHKVDKYYPPMRGGQDPPSTDPPPAGDPQPAPAVDTNKLLADLNVTMQGLSQGMTALAARNVAPAPATEVRAPIAELSDEEINNAFSEGKLADVIRKAIGNSEEKIKREYIEPLQQMGVSSISELTARITKADMPHYNRFKADIDRYIAGMEPAFRMSPNAHKLAHDAVVGANIDVLLKEEREATLRQAAQPPGPAGQLPGSQSGRQTGTGDAIPTVAELFGQESADSLAARGKDPDGFARDLGYKNWEEYAKLAKTQEGGEANA